MTLHQLTTLLPFWFRFSRLRFGKASLQRPSWGRNPFKIWYDPLQFIAVGIAAGCAGVLGGLARLPTVGGVGFWTLAVDCSMLLGLILGMAIIFRLFRSRIVGA